MVDAFVDTDVILSRTQESPRAFDLGNGGAGVGDGAVSPAVPGADADEVAAPLAVEVHVDVPRVGQRRPHDGGEEQVVGARAVPLERLPRPAGLEQGRPALHGEHGARRGVQEDGAAEEEGPVHPHHRRAAGVRDGQVAAPRLAGLGHGERRRAPSAEPRGHHRELADRWVLVTSRV